MAETPLATLKKVIETEPLSPRAVNDAVPRDLETICLKCLEKVPSKRYASASELADDLRRYLHGEPINARPIRGLAQLWRWHRICQRNRDVRIQSATKLFGIPLVSIAFGHDPERGETHGHAKGIIAFGDVATGVIAFGTIARGLIAFGVIAIGVFGWGAIGIGVLACGAIAIGPVAGGGIAVGWISWGGLSVGYYAWGGFAAGVHAHGGVVWRW